MTIQLTDGRRLAKHVEKALGSVEVPMSDRALEAKFADLTLDALRPGAARELMDLCWNVESLADAAGIARAGALEAASRR